MSSDGRRLVSGTDVRGDDSFLTDDFAARFGYAFALWLANALKTTTDKLNIAVGRDSRCSGPRLVSALIKGFTAADCDVMDCGMCTTPAMWMTTKAETERADGAVMVTASHCPPNMNGFKLMCREGSVGAADIGDIVAKAETVKLPNRLVKNVDYLARYRASLADMARKRLEDNALKPLLGLSVVVDAGSGAGGFYAEFLDELGADTEGSINIEPDGAFPNHAPDPGDPAALAALSRAVLDAEADLGVMFDADCDRAAIVDERGRAISGSRLIALISAILLSKEPGGTIVTDSVTSSGLTRFISEWGGSHYRFMRGYRNVIEEARRLNAEGVDCPLAIETSGHSAFRENFFIDDGMYLVTRIICEALDRKRDGETLSALIDGLSEPVESAEIRLRADSEDPAQSARDLIEIVLSHTLENPEWRLANDSREGVRILFNLDGGVENAWFQLRRSVHDEQVIVLNAESDVPGGVKRILTELRAQLVEDVDFDLAPLEASIN